MLLVLKIPCNQPRIDREGSLPFSVSGIALPQLVAEMGANTVLINQIETRIL